MVAPTTLHFLNAATPVKGTTVGMRVAVVTAVPLVGEVMPDEGLLVGVLDVELKVVLAEVELEDELAVVGDDPGMGKSTPKSAQI